MFGLVHVRVSGEVCGHALEWMLGGAWEGAYEGVWDSGWKVACKSASGGA